MFEDCNRGNACLLINPSTNEIVEYSVDTTN